MLGSVRVYTVYWKTLTNPELHHFNEIFEAGGAAPEAIGCWVFEVPKSKV